MIRRRRRRPPRHRRPCSLLVRAPARRPGISLPGQRSDSHRGDKPQAQVVVVGHQVGQLQRRSRGLVARAGELRIRVQVGTVGIAVHFGQRAY